MRERSQDLFQYDHYVDYLKDVISDRDRGFQVSMANAIDCQAAYVSRVLGGQAHFSLEQADRLKTLLFFSEPEHRYFISLVQRDRAGTESLRKYFTEEIERQRLERLELKRRLKVPSEISENDRHIYYSSWVYGAVYVSTSNPQLQDPNSIALKLAIPVETVLETLNFLIGIGLVKKEGSKYRISGGGIHLERSSPQIINHHLTWRLRAMNSIEKNDNKDMHYSLVMSISKKDSMKFKARLVDVIDELNAALPKSKDEEVQALCIDFFDL